MQPPLEIDWPELARLHHCFLKQDGQTESSYWNDQLLAGYDKTLGKRISWKWDFVLQQARLNGWNPRGRNTVVDFGCGTAVAARRLCSHWPNHNFEFYLLDRCEKALSYSTKQLQSEHPTHLVHTVEPEGKIDILLISHVLGELSSRALKKLLKLVRRSKSVLWVEPGSKKVGRTLLRIREQLLDQYNVVAPCTHQMSCPMLNKENQRHWCHHFVDSPKQIFQDPQWALFKRKLRIDLRSLSTSYLILDRVQNPTHPYPERLIGKPQVYKGYAKLMSCGPDHGLRDHKVLKRSQPQMWKQLKSGSVPNHLPSITVSGNKTTH